MKQPTVHHEQMEFLDKIEGQVRGIKKMVDDDRYCVDIITQIHSVIGALYRVEDKIFQKHVNSCVMHALKGKSEIEKNKKIEEILTLMARFRRRA